MNPGSDTDALFMAEGLSKKDFGSKVLTDDQKSTFKYTKFVCIAIMLITTILAFIAVGFFPDSFELKLNAYDDYRDGDALDADGYPLQSADLVGVTRIGLIVAFISLLATIGYGISACAHDSEVSQMNRGSNPFVWIFQLIWVVPFFLVIYFVSGASNVFVLTFVSLAALFWLVVLWADDLITSNAYKLASMIASRRGESTYGWVLYAFVVFAYLVVAICAVIYMFFTFGAAIPPHGILLAIPITLLILYLVIPITYAVNRADGIDQYTRDMILYVYSGFLIVLATWLSLLIFVYDDITPLHPDAAVAAAAL
jgi:hypothetical protein